MSLYNMMHGVKPATFFVLPVLGKHPDEYPRFRDCFIGDDEQPKTEGKIIVYTRTGGGNRSSYAEENAVITQMDGYQFDYDDSFDSTFANFVFDIPEKWVDDVDKMLTGRAGETSADYQDLICGTFPKIDDKLREMFEKVSASTAPA